MHLELYSKSRTRTLLVLRSNISKKKKNLISLYHFYKKNTSVKIAVNCVTWPRLYIHCIYKYQLFGGFFLKTHFIPCSKWTCQPFTWNCTVRSRVIQIFEFSFNFEWNFLMKYNDNWFKFILIVLSRVCFQIQSSFDAELGYIGCVFINHLSKYSKKKRIRNGIIQQVLVTINLFFKTF